MTMRHFYFFLCFEYVLGICVGTSRGGGYRMNENSLLQNTEPFIFGKVMFADQAMSRAGHDEKIHSANGESLI